MFASLAQGTRLDVFLLLVEAGQAGVTAGEIAKRLDVPPSSLTHHLNDLKAAGLADRARNHRQMIYTARMPMMQELIFFMTRNCCGGEPERCSPYWHSGERNKAVVDTSTERMLNVLFLCTGNSARSIIGESILNRLGDGRFKGYSAGSHPAGNVHPRTLRLLATLDYPTEGLRSKSWDEFAAEGAPQMDFVFTVCDDAAKETCPLWPAQPMAAHWGIPDPVAATGGDAEIAAAFNEAYRMLYNRISIFTSLPFASLDRLALQRRLDAIGNEK